MIEAEFDLGNGNNRPRRLNTYRGITRRFNILDLIL